MNLIALTTASLLLLPCAAFGQTPQKKTDARSQANQQAATDKVKDNPLLGVWEVIINGQVIMSYEFAPDGKRIQVIGGAHKTEARYKQDGNKITIVDGARTEVYTFEINEDKLTLKAVDSRKMEELTRKSTEPVG